MTVTTDPNGKIVTVVEVDGAEIQDRFYPLCGNAVETAALTSDEGISVRPDTYLRRVVEA